MVLPLERVKKRSFYFFFTLFGDKIYRVMVRYKTYSVFEIMEKTLKTREKTKIYQEKRGYENNDKNIIYMPRQHLPQPHGRVHTQGYGQSERASGRV